MLLDRPVLKDEPLWQWPLLPGWRMRRHVASYVGMQASAALRFRTLLLPKPSPAQPSPLQHVSGHAGGNDDMRTNSRLDARM